MARGYGITPRSPEHPGPLREVHLPTAWTVAIAGAVAATAAWRTPWLGVVLAALALARRRALVAGVVVALATVTTLRAEDAWRSLRPDRLGPVNGVAEVVGDPQRYDGATRVVVDLDGQRVELWARGRGGRHRVEAWRGGQRVVLAGELVALDSERARRVAWQHVVAELELQWAGDVHDGAPMARASNRVRALIERGSSVLPSDQSVLARGLIIGDDRDQPPEMVERFRASGLSHLTAVSGQNVAFLLAAAGPLLRRRRPGARWVLTIGLIGWFVVLTRAEPSVLRASTMAALSATAFLLGRQREPIRLLALAVVLLLVLDPLLAWSVGFWLSVGATAGVTAIGPWLAGRLSVFGPLAMPAAVTIGAQLGVAAPSLLVFGRLSLVGTVANLVAVPVAGLVMLYGLPACLLAGVVPFVAPVLMVPLGLGVRWIDAVATVGARVEPSPPWSWLGWVATVAIVMAVIVVGRARHQRSHDVS